MQTNFSHEQLRDPAIRTSDRILRACVHCGFCTATCPTFVLLGDERDSPRGRIYLIKEMLEAGRPATAQDALHIDRCLSCLACMTTCPSGVHYMHLVDHARVHIARTYSRPMGDRLIRTVLRLVLPYPSRFRASVSLAQLTRPVARKILPVPTGSKVPARTAREGRVAAENKPLKGRSTVPGAVNTARRSAPKVTLWHRLGAMVSLAPADLPPAETIRRPAVFRPETAPVKRMALLSGCAQRVLSPAINAATVRLLNRLGVEVVLPKGEGCCGALVHHMGLERDAHAAAKANIDAWWSEIEGEGLDAIAITASGCGTTIKDYGFMLKADPQYAEKAAAVSKLAKDITEILEELPFPESVQRTDATIAYHSACSMQHGQKLTRPPKALLTKAGFTVKDVPEGHLCCGSAGTYNIMQPGIAAQLKERKLANLALTGADIVATGNIGCLTQLQDADRPVVHTVELLDWATGGPAPEKAAERLSARVVEPEAA